MFYDTITLAAGSAISNMTVESGASLPASATLGGLFFKTTDNTMYVYNGSVWVSNSGVSSVNVTAPSEGITVSGGPITSSGSLTLALANDLAALEALTGTGLVRRTGISTWATGAQVNLATEVTGNLAVSSLAGGVSASSTTFWRGDGSWATPIGGVTTVNTRAGDVTLISSDITSALTFTPVNKAGDTLTGYLLLNDDPTQALGAVTKQYVDNIAANLAVHDSVRAATSANLSATYANGTAGVGATLTASANGVIPTIGGVADLIVGDRVLVKDQTTGFQNGIYVVSNAGSAGTPYVLTRASDFDNSPSFEVSAGDFAFVVEGTVGGTQWVLTTPGAVTIGSTALSFTQLSGSGSYTAGTGISINSNQIANTGVLTVASRSGNVTLAVADVTGAAPLASPTFTGTVTAPTFSGTFSGTATAATSATNIIGGTAGGVPYQTGAGATSITSAGTSGQVLTSNGTGAPSWTTLSSSTAAGTLTGTTLAANVVNSSLTSVGTLSSLAVTNGVTASSFTGAHSGSGASLTSIPNGALVNSSITIGSSAVSLGATLTTIAGLTSVTSTSFVGALTGTASLASNIVGGVAGGVPYQTGAGATSITAAGTAGQFLQSNGAGAPTWAAPSVAGSALTGTSLAANIVTSSLTSVGTLSSLAVTGAITTGGVEVGTKTMPQNSKSVDYTLVLADSGQHIFHPAADTTTRTYTIPANSSVAYPVGTAITFVVQNGAGNITIAITSDTMRLAGAGTTGSRTLSANGVATALKITSTEWIISGTNLS